jgi:hypothetical protein
LSAGRKFSRNRAGLARQLVIVEHQPAESFVPVTSQELPCAFRHMKLDHRRLRQSQVAFAKDRNLAHGIDRAKGRVSCLAVEEIDKNRGPVVMGQIQGQGRLVGIAGFAKAPQFRRHPVPPTAGGFAPPDPRDIFVKKKGRVNPSSTFCA